MGFCFKPTLSVTLGLSQGVVDGGERGVARPCLYLRLGQRGGKDRHIEPDSALAARLDCRAHFRQTGFAVG